MVDDLNSFENCWWCVDAVGVAVGVAEGGAAAVVVVVLLPQMDSLFPHQNVLVALSTHPSVVELTKYYLN